MITSLLMTTRDLDEDELLALVALLRIVVQADDILTIQERHSLAAIAAELGQQRFLEITQQVQQRLPNATLSTIAGLVTRAEARRYIHDKLVEVARCDGIVPSEIRRLSQLKEQWGLTD